MDKCPECGMNYEERCTNCGYIPGMIICDNCGQRCKEEDSRCERCNSLLLKEEPLLGETFGLKIVIAFIALVLTLWALLIK